MPNFKYFRKIWAIIKFEVAKTAAAELLKMSTVYKNQN